MVHAIQHRLLHLDAVHLVSLHHLLLVQGLDGKLAAAVAPLAAGRSLELHQPHRAHVALAQVLGVGEVGGADGAVALQHLRYRRPVRVVCLVGLALDGHRAVHRLEHVAGIRELRHHPRHLAHLLLVLACWLFILTSLLLLGDVALHSHKEPHRAVVVKHGGDGEHVPEGGAVLAVVEQAHGALARGANGVADLLHGARVRLRALQEAAVAAQHLLAAVPREVEEVVRGKHDGVVRQRRVRDDEVLLDALQGGAQVQTGAAAGHGGNLAELPHGVDGVLGAGGDARVPVPLDLGHLPENLLDVGLAVLLDARVVLHQQGQALLVRVRRRHHALRLGGDIHLHANELGDGAVLELDGDDGEEVPEGRAVLAVVEQPQGDAATLLGRRADLGHVRPVRLLPL
mmetsp:Transcript_3149/g.6183  ORF Transcript_3149/g.6183 Transcript_3149/m.6183 type:complete len:400 (+) Transcript_3149:215-1414(+)